MGSNLGESSVEKSFRAIGELEYVLKTLIYPTIIVYSQYHFTFLFAYITVIVSP